MKNIIEKVGMFSYKKPWVAVIGWIAVLTVTVTGAVAYMQPPSESMSIPGTAADLGFVKMREMFPEAGQGVGRIVVAAPTSQTLDGLQGEVELIATKISEVPGVVQAVSPFVNPNGISKDRTTGIIQMSLSTPSGETSKETVDEVEVIIDEARQETGMQIEMNGDIIRYTPDHLLGGGEIIGLVAAFVVLLVMFKGLLVAGLPLINALFGVAITATGLFSLSQVIDINSSTPALAVMLGLAVGIDYSLFIISKYRDLASEGRSSSDATKDALGTSGVAVVYAASTVVVALLALSVLKIPFLTTMGLAAASAVVVATLIAIILLPVYFRFFGSRIATAVQSVSGSRSTGTKQSKRYKVVRFAASNWVIVGLLVVGFASIAALPVRDLTLGLPNDQYAAQDTTQHKAYNLISQAFGEGNNSPLIMVVDGLDAVSQVEKDTLHAELIAQMKDKLAQEQSKMEKQIQARLMSANSPAERMAIMQEVESLKTQSDVKMTEATAQVDQASVELGKRLHLQKVTDAITEDKSVIGAIAAMASDDGMSGVIQITPRGGPYDDSTTDLLASLRSAATQSTWGLPADAEVYITGTAAMQHDVNQKISDALPVYFTTIAVLAFVLMLIAFKSLLIPVIATVGYILSVLAMFGAMTAIFQWGWLGITNAPGPITSFVPLITSGILFGLAMDYVFFLVSGIHEEYERSRNAKDSVLRAYRMGSSVVVAAALIMIVVFAGFATNSNNIVQTLGLSLAFGILVDAFLVRLLLMPSLMYALGDKTWWLPGKASKKAKHQK